MPRKKKTDDPIGVGLTAKQMRRKKPINADLLVDIDPLTANQEKFFEEYDAGKHLFAYGCAGTGKTFIALYKALKEVLDLDTPYEKIYIVRSLVSTREIGFLPGDHEDKSYLFQVPYKKMVKYMFQMPSDSDFERAINGDINWSTGDILNFKYHTPGTWSLSLSFLERMRIKFFPKCTCNLCYRLYHPYEEGNYYWYME